MAAPSESFIQHAARIPVVKSTTETAAFIYGRLKNLHPLATQSANYAETLATTGYSYLTDALQTVQPAVNLVDSIANKGLNLVEHNFPIVREPTATVIVKTLDTIKPIVMVPLNYVRSSISRMASSGTTDENQQASGQGEKKSTIKEFLSNPLQAASQYIGPNVLVNAKTRMESVLKATIELTKLLDSPTDNRDDSIDMNALESYLTDSERIEIDRCNSEEEKRVKLTMIISNRIKADIQYVNESLMNVLPGPLKSGYGAGTAMCENIYKDLSQRQSSESDNTGNISSMALQGVKSLNQFARTALVWLDKAISSEKQEQKQFDS